MQKSVITSQLRCKNYVNTYSKEMTHTNKMKAKIGKKTKTCNKEKRNFATKNV